VGTTLVNPSLGRAGRAGGRTAFERNILPGFARWVIAQIEAYQPDYLVPAETKGARVLEAVLRHAREELGSPIVVPVLYGSGLAYLDPEELATKRLLMVDDAVRTGVSIKRNIKRVRGFGAKELKAIACIGDGEHASDRAEPFLSVGTKLYDEYVRQLTELVVARGLPPEIDHLIFEIRFPVRLTTAWAELENVLSALGTLTIDGPVDKAGEIMGMTLHFPDLAGRRSPDPAVRERQIDKLRFFPDPANDCLYVVAVAFPALSLAGGEEDRPVSPKLAREAIGSVLGAGTVGDLLVAAAKTLKPKTVFRALSTAAEVESVRALAKVLSAAFPTISIAAHRDSFDRLYGPRTGRLITSHVAAELGLALSDPVAELERGDPEQAPYLDEEVVNTTHEIVERLKKLHIEATERDDYDPSERTGLSMPGILDEFPDSDPLLISRCIDYAMAMTMLVPFPGRSSVAGTFTFERKYRVSERDRRPYDDVGENRIDLSEQAAALIAHNLIVRSGGTVSAVPPRRLTDFVAILRPLVLEDQSIALTVRPGDSEPQLMLVDEEHPIAFGERTSTFYDVDGDGAIAPTPTFGEAYNAPGFTLAIRESVHEIEARVRMLLSLLEEIDEDEAEKLLRGWAMSTDCRLGLTHVMHSSEAALDTLSAPLRLVVRRVEHEAAAGAAEQVASHAEWARGKLELLSTDWQAPAFARWKPDLWLERDILESMAVPKKPLHLYAFQEALAVLIAEMGALVERLERASADHWTQAGTEADEEAIAVAALALTIAARAQRGLSTFDDGTPTVAVAPEDPRAALELAGKELLSTLALGRALLAAASGAYRGPKGNRIVPPSAEKRNSSVVSLDIAGSTAYGRDHPETHTAWKNEGLDMATQWMRALSGREGRFPEGDDLWFEFGVGDPAVLATAAAQAHADALGSTGLHQITRRFRAAVDAGELELGAGNCTMGKPMDRVVKLARKCDKDRETAHVFVTPEAFNLLSSGLRDDSLRDLEWEREVEVDSETSVLMHAFDSHRVLERFAERIKTLAASLGEEIAAAAGGLEVAEAGAAEEDAELVQGGS
jgi:hypothetical protein